MNAPSPSDGPLRHPRIPLCMLPALVPVSIEVHAAANDDTEPIARTETKGPYSAVNPLWMITAALALFLAAMAILISSSNPGPAYRPTCSANWSARECA